MYSSINRSPNSGGIICPRCIRKRQVRQAGRGREAAEAGLGRWILGWDRESGKGAKLWVRGAAWTGYLGAGLPVPWDRKGAPSPCGQVPRNLTIIVDIICKPSFMVSLSISFWVSELFMTWVVGESRVGDTMGLELRSPEAFPLDGLPRTWRLGSGPHRGHDPTELIVVYTNDAGDRVQVGRGQQLLGVLGQEDTVHQARDDAEGLKNTQGQVADTF